MTPLHRASWNGHNECVRALLQEGADVKIPVKDQEGRTALVLAYEKWDLGHQSAYEDPIFQLIEKDPLAAKGDTELLSLCAAHGSLRIIRQLQEIGTDFNPRDRYGWTPLELARQFRRAEVEQILKKQMAWKGATLRILSPRMD
ncbi:ankyrin repeat-containing domain protein [Xylaria digitata]|nr:ankyrin repeat-containing domain protein [Xylaria digitata]